MMGNKKPPQGTAMLKRLTMKIDKDTLYYVEAQAQKLSAFRLETMELLSKRAHTLVTLLLGGGGALAAFAISLLEKKVESWLYVGVFAAAAWLFMIAALATLKCLRTLEVVPPGFNPRGLLASPLPVDELRRWALESLDGRMQGWAQRNNSQALWLDRAYLAAAVTPLVAILFSVAVYWLVPGVQG
jgi:hypothetical protein